MDYLRTHLGERYLRVESVFLECQQPTYYKDKHKCKLLKLISKPHNLQTANQQTVSIRDSFVCELSSRRLRTCARTVGYLKRTVKRD